MHKVWLWTRGAVPSAAVPGAALETGLGTVLPGAGGEGEATQKITRSTFYRSDLRAFGHLSFPGAQVLVQKWWLFVTSACFYSFFFFYPVLLQGTWSLGTHSCSVGDAASPMPGPGQPRAPHPVCVPRRLQGWRTKEKDLFVRNASVEIITANYLFSPRGNPCTKPFPASSLLKHSVLICEIKSGSGDAVVICRQLMEKVDADIDLPLHVAFTEFPADCKRCDTETVSARSVITRFR